MDFISDFRKAKKAATATSNSKSESTSAAQERLPSVETKGIDSLFARPRPSSGDAQRTVELRSPSPGRSRSSSSSSSISSDMLDDDEEPPVVQTATAAVATASGVSKADLRHELTTARVGLCDKWIYSCMAVDGELGLLAFPLRDGGLKVYTDQLNVVLPGQVQPGDVHDALALEGRGVVIAAAANVVFVWDLAHAKDSSSEKADPVAIEISQTSTVVKLAQVGRTGMCLVGTSTGNVKVVDASDASRPYLAPLVLDAGGGGMVTVLATNREGSIWLIGNENCIAACEFHPSAWVTVWVNPENDLWMEMPNGTSIDLPRAADTVFDILFRRDGIIALATCLGEFDFDAATGTLRSAQPVDSDTNRSRRPRRRGGSEESCEIVAARFDKVREKLLTLTEAEDGGMEVAGFGRSLSLSPWMPTGRNAVCELPRGGPTEKLLSKLSKDAAAGVRTWDLGRWEGVLLCGGQQGLRCYIYSAWNMSVLFTSTSETPVTTLCADLTVGTVFAGYSDGSVLSLATKFQVYSCDEAIHSLQMAGNYLIVTTESGRRVQVDHRLLIANSAPGVDAASLDVVVGQFPGVTVRRFGLVESARWTVLACEGSDIVAAQIVDAGGDLGRCVAVANEDGVAELIRLQDGVLVGRGLPDEDVGENLSLIWVTVGGRILRFHDGMSRVAVSSYAIDEAADDEAEVVLAQRAYLSRLDVLESTLDITQRMQEQIRQGAVIEASQRAANRAVATATTTFGHIRDKLIGTDKQQQQQPQQRRSSTGRGSEGGGAQSTSAPMEDTKEMLDRARAQIVNNQEKLADIQEKSAQMSEQSEDMLRMARNINKKQQHKKWIFF
ncbi:hypothetical protein FOZ61_000342 [Perkinsus olseni]|uniref:V-SNARE coiled-coil homology domain-containing protein n=1 Tax=Perkinsus olseni TaxID=32597 RepID=A0A7J6M0E7_PEROL|nr:hypothetical protein FOZ61_000342 [Perkinsus olseni]